MNLKQIEFDFKSEDLLIEAETNQFEVYHDDKHGKNENWKILKGDSLYLPRAWEEANRFCKYFGLENGVPRYYILDSDSYLMPHIDYNTTCSVNHVLSADAAPVTVEGKDYLYKTALLNTSVIHGVNNKGKKERILYKISFFDEDYEAISRKV